nr:hypothetical protein [Tanacetum cinerariifolium]
MSMTSKISRTLEAAKQCDMQPGEGSKRSFGKPATGMDDATGWQPCAGIGNSNFNSFDERLENIDLINPDQLNSVGESLNILKKEKSTEGQLSLAIPTTPQFNEGMVYDGTEATDDNGASQRYNTFDEYGQRGEVYSRSSALQM